MNARPLVILAAVCVTALACSPKRIPGTQIDDTEDTRAILQLMETYRQAVETQDVPALVKLASPKFLDASGTSNPDDDLTYNNLQPALEKRFDKVENVNLVLDVRTIDVEDRKAQAIYYYTLRYDMPGLASARQSASDLKRMDLERIEGQWRIVSGL